MDQSAFDSRLLIASIQTFLIKNHNLIELRKPLILSYTNNCISITQKMLFTKIIFSYGWETAMILYKKTFFYLKNNNENKNTMFNKTEIKKNILSFFFRNQRWKCHIDMFFYINNTLTILYLVIQLRLVTLQRKFKRYVQISNDKKRKIIDFRSSCFYPHNPFSCTITSNKNKICVCLIMFNAVVSSTSHHAFVAGICTRKHCLLQFNVTFKRSKLADKM